MPSELEELRKEIAQLRAAVGLPKPSVPKPPKAEVSGKTPVSPPPVAPERAWAEAEYVRRGGGGPYQARKPPGMAFPLREGGGPVALWQQFLEDSIYPITDPHGARSPFWEKEWRANLTGEEPWTNLDYWNRFANPIRRFWR